MTYVDPVVRIGIVEFSEPTLLLLGDSRAFLWLADQVAKRVDFTLTPVPRLAGKSHVSLRFLPATHGGELHKEDDRFWWTISVEEAQEVARQLRELANSGAPGHAYLDPGSNTTGVQVMVSKGEYDAQSVFFPSR